MGSTPGEGTLALWLTVEGEAREQIAKVIHDLARETVGPAFVPHVTLLSGIRRTDEEVVSALASSGALAPAPAIELVRVSSSGSYYQAVVLEVALTEDLSRLRGRVERLFGMPPTPFSPHLSLVYGELPAAQREAIMRDARVQALLSLRFEVRRLEIWSVRGPTSAWSCCGHVELPPR